MALTLAAGSGERGRSLLKEKAYAELKALIKDGTLSPGTFLSERELALRLGMSKTPIRSALDRLDSEGFVSISPQQGVIVRELSLQEIVDLFNIRVALETFVVRELAGRLETDDRARIEANLDRQLQLAEGRDVPGSIGLDTDFHILLCEAHDNREIVRTLWQLRDKLHRVVARIMDRDRDGTRLISAYEEHRGIVQAIIDQDGELAAGRMAEHLEWGKRFLVSG